jgi:Na+-driven multidrug efflux pump
MQKNIKQWWSDLKSFDWKMYLALCLLALVPAIYQTIITKLITVNTNPGALDIIGQMEWFDLINETICAFLIVPMYSVLSKAKNAENFSRVVFKLGILVVGLYVLFSLGTFFYGIHLVSYMNPNEIDVVAAYRYLSLETIAFMIGIIYSYVNVVFIVLGKSKYMYSFLVGKILLSLLSDLILIPNFGVEGVAISNIISNVVVGLIGVVILFVTKNIKADKFVKEDLSHLKMWGKVGLFAGSQQFLDNIIYALMIVRMVNAVSESGNYWVSNNFIWGWLLIPITCLAEIIRKDAGLDGYKLKQRNYYSIVIFSLMLWIILIPTYQWFFKTVEGIDNYSRIFEIVIKNLGFYVFFALSQIPDAIFVGMGKTKYNAINSLICNFIYYGIWFVLYQTKVVVMNMDMIIVMFGVGNIVHWLISIIEEKIFLKKELKYKKSL